MLIYDLLMLVTMNLVDNMGYRRGLGGRGRGVILVYFMILEMLTNALEY